MFRIIGTIFLAFFISTVISAQTDTLFLKKWDIHPDSVKEPFLFNTIDQWIGTPYQYAGNSQKGIDCSGFTCMLYETVYCKKIIRGSAAIFKTVQPVSKENLKEGDMVFFKIRRNTISHVGVYIGNNKFAHASVHSGVIISDMNEEYYKKRFYSGGRVESTK